MAENTDLRLTIEAWADIVTDNWFDKIDKLKIGYSFQLEESIRFELIGNSGNMPERVDFTFNHYGKFVDMGVGKGVEIGDVKDRGESRRRPKKWYSKTMYAQIIKLREILAKKYGRVAAISIIENIDDNALRWVDQRV
jgi:hypothetical protein